MSIYEGLIIASFVMITIIMINQYIDSEVPRLRDVLQSMSVIPCYKIITIKNGKRIKTSELIQHMNSRVKVHGMKEGILYIEIY